MTKTLRNIVSISLVLIFIIPITTKFLDGLFHHHGHFFCTAKHEQHFHAFHEKCPVPNFELALYSLEKQFKVRQKVQPGDELIINYFFVYSYNHSKYSFLLRAPPVFTNTI